MSSVPSRTLRFSVTAVDWKYGAVAVTCPLGKDAAVLLPVLCHPLLLPGAGVDVQGGGMKLGIGRVFVQVRAAEPKAGRVHGEKACVEEVVEILSE
jgi:hypothetical protein